MFFGWYQIQISHLFLLRSYFVVSIFSINSNVVLCTCVCLCACILGCLNALSLYSNASVCFYLNCNFNQYICMLNACWVKRSTRSLSKPSNWQPSFDQCTMTPFGTVVDEPIPFNTTIIRIFTPPFLIHLSLSLSHELSSMCGTNWSYRFKCGLKLIESTPLPPNPSIQFECCAYFWVDVRDGNSKHFSFHLYILCTLCLICFICRVVIYHYTRM